MAQSFLIFDFGKDEEMAQRARRRVEGWKQAFRLGSKLELKFERQAGEGEEKEAKTETVGAAEKTRSGSREEKQPAGSDARGGIRLFLKLNFSDHERLSHQRWLERIPAEEPFKSAKSEIVRSNEAAFAKTADLFDTLT